MVNEGKREFRVDSGASVPIVGKIHLTPEEAHTIPASKTLCETLTAHGTVFTCGEATVHFEDLDMFVTGIPYHAGGGHLRRKPFVVLLLYLCPVTSGSFREMPVQTMMQFEGPAIT